MQTSYKQVNESVTVWLNDGVINRYTPILLLLMGSHWLRTAGYVVDTGATAIEYEDI